MSAFLVEQGQSGEGLALEIQLVLGICGHAGIMLSMKEGNRALLSLGEVERAYTFCLVINLKTAQALGLTPSPLLRWWTRCSRGVANRQIGYTAKLCMFCIPR